MKLSKMFALVVLSSAVAVGCGKKKDEGGAAKAAPDAAAAKAPVVADAAAVTPPPVVADAAAAAVPTDPAAKVLPPLVDGELPSDWWDTGCVRVMRRMGECAADAAFVKALQADAEAGDVKEIAERAESIKRFADAEKVDGSCVELSSVTYEDEGFLDGDWRVLDDEALLKDCAALGAKVNGLGGLFGGSTDS